MQTAMRFKDTAENEALLHGNQSKKKKTWQNFSLRISRLTSSRLSM